MRRISTILLLIMFFISSNASADPAFVRRPDVQLFIDKMVRQHQFNRRDLLKTMAQVQIQPQIIESMEKPYEKKPWDVYKQLFLTPQRVQGGIEFWQQNQQALEKAEKLYGVPANIIVAIIGVETLYGKHQGNYRVLDALSTLAFNYPKRAVFFNKELEEYLLLCREQHIQPAQYMGSYAGAIGKPQFMPSSYRHYAANLDNSPKKDLINDDKAVIASVANYFYRHGWTNNEGVAQPAKIVGSGYKHINLGYRSAAYTAKQLAQAGVFPVTAAYHHPNRAGLIELTTAEGLEYWLAYPNFYVITRYNTSPQYALAVYLLAQQLKNQWAEASSARKHFAYV